MLMPGRAGECTVNSRDQIEKLLGRESLTTFLENMLWLLFLY